MPKLTIANQDYESLAEKITTPSIILTEISSGNESYYIPLFEGNYNDGSIVQLGDYNYTLGKLKVGSYRAAIIREGIVTDVYITPVKIFASDYTTWILTVDDELYGCGWNAEGQQGAEDVKNVLTFTKRAENVKEVFCTGNTTWYLTNDNELYGCGCNYDGNQGSGEGGNKTHVKTFTKRAENVKEVSCSKSTTWYIDFDNNLYGCGIVVYGQQGNGESGYDSANVLTFTKRAENVKKVSCSFNTTWYLTNDNELYGCGFEWFGQQGTGDYDNVLTFTKRAENVKDVSCSYGTTWYIDNNDNLYGCGYNAGGNQGSGSTTNIRTFTKRAENVKKVSCTGETTWYIDNNDNLYGCGLNKKDIYAAGAGGGQQGSGDYESVLAFTKRAENVKDVSCSKSSTWYLTNDNELYGCGWNAGGNQGNGTEGEDALTFTKRAENVKEFSCSEETTWYLTNDNELYGCGVNYYGQQGTGDKNDVLTFTKRDIIKCSD